ncbi:MAG TPA: TIGR04282 family arsenosugar biosynthesis glycosyltransferase [Bacillales bacterium]
MDNGPQLQQKNNRPALLIFAKAPIPGYCKTRMEPDLSPEQCAELQEALLKDTIRLKENLDAKISIWMAYTPEENKDYFRRLSSQVVPQKSGDLGERMSQCLNHLFNQGYAPIIIIGTDTPLSSEGLNEAFKILKFHDAVIGPSVDGGYYLLGLNCYEPELFKDISWSTSHVFRQTHDKINQSGLTVQSLRQNRDIDDFQDLQAYRDVETNPHLDQWKQKFFNENG